MLIVRFLQRGDSTDQCRFHNSNDAKRFVIGAKARVPRWLAAGGEPWAASASAVGGENLVRPCHLGPT